MVLPGNGGNRGRRWYDLAAGVDDARHDVS